MIQSRDKTGMMAPRAAPGLSGKRSRSKADFPTSDFPTSDDMMASWNKRIKEEL